MILVTRLNNAPFYINEDLIEYIEETPDTIISFDNGRKIAVTETPVRVVELIREEKINIIKATQF